MEYDKIKFSELVGKTVIEIIQEKNLRTEQIEQLTFKTAENRNYLMYHAQDCCEYVYLEDICGDLNDLLNTPILQAEKSSNSDDPVPSGYFAESYTWTFYRISTAKGLVVLRWYGSSNGYYSEGVNFEEIES